jgi:hypothetical protein
MPLTPDQSRVLESIRDEWGRAERDIKLAEQVCNEIVFPSINELRYGGRRVVDTVRAVVAGSSQKDIDALLADALFDCHRARHDAIDTATAKIAITIDIMVSKLKYEAILPCYADFPILVSDLAAVRKKVSISRKDRENREAIYTVIEETDFPALVDRYQGLQASEPIMKRLAKRNRWKDAIGYIGFVIGIIGLPLGAWGIWLAYHPPIAVQPEEVHIPLTPPKNNDVASSPATGAKLDNARPRPQ